MKLHESWFLLASCLSVLASAVSHIPTFLEHLLEIVEAKRKHLNIPFFNKKS